jgi:uncharacterized protein
MFRSEAHVPTSAAERYAKQLCSHMAHRVTTEWTPPHGVIEFPGDGKCHLTARDEELVLVAEATSPATLSRVQMLVGGHLERFGRRDAIEVGWS